MSQQQTVLNVDDKCRICSIDKPDLNPVIINVCLCKTKVHLPCLEQLRTTNRECQFVCPVCQVVWWDQVDSIDCNQVLTFADASSLVALFNDGMYCLVYYFLPSDTWCFLIESAVMEGLSALGFNFEEKLLQTFPHRATPTIYYSQLIAMLDTYRDTCDLISYVSKLLVNSNSTQCDLSIRKLLIVARIPILIDIATRYYQRMSLRERILELRNEDRRVQFDHNFGKIEHYATVAALISAQFAYSISVMPLLLFCPNKFSSILQYGYDTFSEQLRQVYVNRRQHLTPINFVYKELSRKSWLYRFLPNENHNPIYYTVPVLVTLVGYKAYNLFK